MREITRRRMPRFLLGGTLLFAGVGHLTFARKAITAEVPDWVPLGKDDTVVYSGIVELALGSALSLAGEKSQVAVGWVTAAFLVAVFPFNISQYLNRRSAFGLDTDGKRLARLFFQPLFIYWALKSTQRCALSFRRERRHTSDLASHGQSMKGR